MTTIDWPVEQKTINAPVEKVWRIAFMTFTNMPFWTTEGVNPDEYFFRGNFFEKNPKYARYQDEIGEKIFRPFERVEVKLRKLNDNQTTIEMTAMEEGSAIYSKRDIKKIIRFIKHEAER
jgi:hypothetical protein